MGETTPSKTLNIVVYIGSEIFFFYVSKLVNGYILVLRQMYRTGKVSPNDAQLYIYKIAL